MSGLRQQLVACGASFQNNPVMSRIMFGRGGVGGMERAVERFGLHDLLGLRPFGLNGPRERLHAVTDEFVTPK